MNRYLFFFIVVCLMGERNYIMKPPVFVTQDGKFLVKYIYSHLLSVNWYKYNILDKLKYTEIEISFVKVDKEQIFPSLLCVDCPLHSTIKVNKITKEQNKIPF